jgi:hypothetical protein
MPFVEKTRTKKIPPSFNVKKMLSSKYSLYEVLHSQTLEMNRWNKKFRTANKSTRSGPSSRLEHVVQIFKMSKIIMPHLCVGRFVCKNSFIQSKNNTSLY